MSLSDHFLELRQKAADLGDWNMLREVEADLTRRGIHHWPPLTDSHAAETAGTQPEPSTSQPELDDFAAHPAEGTPAPVETTAVAPDTETPEEPAPKAKKAAG